MKADNEASGISFKFLNIDNVTGQQSVVICCSKNISIPFDTEFLKMLYIVIEHAVGIHWEGGTRFACCSGTGLHSDGY